MRLVCGICLLLFSGFPALSMFINGAIPERFWIYMSLASLGFGIYLTIEAAHELGVRRQSLEQSDVALLQSGTYAILALVHVRGVVIVMIQLVRENRLVGPFPQLIRFVGVLEGDPRRELGQGDLYELVVNHDNGRSVRLVSPVDSGRVDIWA